MPSWTTLPPILAVFGPGLAAFAAALAGVALVRRREAAWPAVAAGAVLLGWMLAMPAPRGWVVPRVLAEHLVVPAAAALLSAAAAAALRGRARSWAHVLLLGVAAWWLAGAVRPEFWRVWFAVAGVAWWLRLTGARVAGGAAVAGLVLVAGGVAAGVGPVWTGVAAVLAGAGLGVAALRPGAVLGVIAPAAGIVAFDLGTGGLVRGRVGAADLVCAAALLAPAAARGLERAAGRRFGRFGRVVAAAMAVAAAVGLAMAGAWALARTGPLRR